MAMYNLPSETGINFTTGVDKIFVYVAGEVPIFIPMLLLAIYGIVFLGGYFSQSRRETRVNPALWLTIAGFVTTIAMLSLSLIEGLITLPIMVVTVSITIISLLIFLFTNN